MLEGKAQRPSQVQSLVISTSERTPLGIKTTTTTKKNKPKAKRCRVSAPVALLCAEITFAQPERGCFIPWRLRKAMGLSQSGSRARASRRVSASCHRVSVVECVSVDPDEALPPHEELPSPK